MVCLPSWRHIEPKISMLDYVRCIFLVAPKCSLRHSPLTSLNVTLCVVSLHWQNARVTTVYFFSRLNPSMLVLPLPDESLCLNLNQWLVPVTIKLQSHVIWRWNLKREPHDCTPNILMWPRYGQAEWSTGSCMDNTSYVFFPIGLTYGSTNEKEKLLTTLDLEAGK